MAKPEKSKSGCFSSFLRVLLCAGNGATPPVHPSDHVTESDETEHQNKDAMVDDNDAATPGVVARLMGLDSLPNTNLLTKLATPDSVPRSRSVNFVDYLLEFDLNKTNNHRRVKTSASFREVPALTEGKKNHDLVVLYWDDDDNVSKDQEFRSNLKKKEIGFGELSKQKKNKEVLRERVSSSSSVKKELNQGKKSKKISKLKNETRRVPSSKRSRMVRNHHCEANDFCTVSSSSESCSYRYSGVGSTSNSNSALQSKKKKKGFVEPKFPDNKRNQKSTKKIETEYNLENLSPVSLPDTNDYPFLYGTDFKDCSHNSSPLVAKSKWKSSSLVSLGDGVENKDCAYSTDLNRDAEYYSELILKLRSLTENDIRKSDITSKGIYENEDFEEICFLFEHKILDLLLHEFVNEVVKLSC